jgi:hypothetical protein
MDDVQISILGAWFGRDATRFAGTDTMAVARVCNSSVDFATLSVSVGGFVPLRGLWLFEFVCCGGASDCLFGVSIAVVCAVSRYVHRLALCNDVPNAQQVDVPFDCTVLCLLLCCPPIAICGFCVCRGQCLTSSVCCSIVCQQFVVIHCSLCGVLRIGSTVLSYCSRLSVLWLVLCCRLPINCDVCRV